MTRRTKRREIVTGKAYRLGHTIEILRGHLVELEVLLRDVALSGEASNEDLNVGLVKLAGGVVSGALRLERACHRLRQMGWRPAPRRSRA